MHFRQQPGAPAETRYTRAGSWLLRSSSTGEGAAASVSSLPLREASSPDRRQLAIAGTASTASCLRAQATAGPYAPPPPASYDPQPVPLTIIYT